MEPFPKDLLIIVQARMGSTRYPGKTLAPLGGKPTLAHLLDSLSQVAPKSAIVVATSTNVEDRQIVDFCNNSGIQVRQGDPENVASRFLSIIEEFHPSYWFRISGDSPLLDHRIILDVMNLLTTEPDIVSTSYQDPFPSGMNVEAVRSKLFIQHYPLFKSPEHFEHVTKYFYESGEPNRPPFGIVPLRCGIPDARSYKFTFDDAKDRARLETLFNSFTKPHYNYTLAEKCAISAQLGLKTV